MRKATIKATFRIALSSLYLLIAILLQCGLFPYFRLFGAVPCVVLCAVVCISVFEDERASCIMALAAGFLLDTVGGGSFTYSPLTFLLAASVSILFSRRLFRGRFLPAAASAAIAIICDSAINVALLLFSGAEPFIKIAVGTGLPQILYGCLVFLPVWLLTLLHYKIFGVLKE